MNFFLTFIIIKSGKVIVIIRNEEHNSLISVVKLLFNQYKRLWNRTRQ